MPEYDQEKIQEELQKIKDFVLANTGFKVVNLSVKFKDKELRLVLAEKDKDD